MPKKPHNISQDDIDAFHKAMEGTKPLTKKKIRLSPPLPHSHRLTKKAQQFDDKLLNFNQAFDVEEVRSEEFIAYKQVSVSNKILRKLRKGQYNVDATLDLHGLSVEEAKNAVDDFLQECLREKIRIVLIIHGKGRHSQMPILKNKLNHWLREINVVLAFCSAAPTHGSRGAIYVLLKRVEETQD